MAAEDDVDTESLQAQIDMSMSFAHDLVTSWIKPAHLAQLRSSGVNATQLLEEELRRPPRLGVGTSIPTAPPLAHVASKLKRRLGKNDAKNQGVAESQPQDSPKSDDEEHKGRPTKRKSKTDPFGHEGSKKKRKAESEANPCPSVKSVSPHSVSLLKNSTSEELPKHNSPSVKEKQQMGPGHQESHVTEGQRSTTLVFSLPVRLPVQTTFSPSLTVPTVPSLSAQSRDPSDPVPGMPTTPEMSQLHVNFIPIPDKAKPLGIPLLNLDGPPELTDKPGNTSELNNRRKKRKRRKKKKAQMITGTGDNSHHD